LRLIFDGIRVNRHKRPPLRLSRWKRRIPIIGRPRLWKLLQTAKHAPDDQIVIGIQEVPSSQAMEMGQIMPEVDGG
jgi:hypothetical protein